MMKYLLFVLLSVSLYAQNVWYVDRDATGANTGRSWTDAWTTTDSVWGSGLGVNWNIVQAGDTVYISGGSDSTRYGAVGGAVPSIRGVQNDPSAPNFTPQVVVCPSWESGHNGEVWFYTEDTTAAYAFISRDISGIKFVNINFMTNIAAGYDNHTSVVLVEENERITFENCLFRNSGTGGALGLGGAYNIIDSCTIENLTNSNITDQDIFTMGGGKGGHTIRNSTIIQRSIVDSTDAHPDFIQIGSMLGVEDNLLSDANTNFSSGNAWTTTGDWIVHDGFASYKYVNDASGSLKLTMPAATAELYWIIYRIYAEADTADDYTLTIKGGNGYFAQSDTSIRINQDNFFTNGYDACYFMAKAGETNFEISAAGFGAGDSLSISLVMIGKVGETAETLFENNFMWQITPNRQSEYNSFIYVSSGYNLHWQKFTWINNIMILDIPDTNYTGTVNGVAGIWMRGKDGVDNSMYSLRLFGNVLISKSGSLLLTECDTLIMKNNIFIQTADVTVPYMFSMGRVAGAFAAAYKDIDYNHWYVNNWTATKKFWGDAGQIEYSWGEWQAAGYDVHSDTGSLNLVTVSDSVITAYYTTTGRDIGTNLSYLSDTYPNIVNDILGNPRTGEWDMGALEYQGVANAYLRSSNGKLKIDKDGKIVKGK